MAFKIRNPGSSRRQRRKSHHSHSESVFSSVRLYEANQPRYPKGHPKGGQFIPKGERGSFNPTGGQIKLNPVGVPRIGFGFGHDEVTMVSRPLVRSEAEVKKFVRDNNAKLPQQFWQASQVRRIEVTEFTSDLHNHVANVRPDIELPRKRALKGLFTPDDGTLYSAVLTHLGDWDPKSYLAQVGRTVDPGHKIVRDFINEAGSDWKNGSDADKFASAVASYGSGQARFLKRKTHRYFEGLKRA